MVAAAIVMRPLFRKARRKYRDGADHADLRACLPLPGRPGPARRQPGVVAAGARRPDWRQDLRKSGPEEDHVGATRAGGT